MSASRPRLATLPCLVLLAVLTLPAAPARVAAQATLNSWCGLSNSAPWDPPDALGAVGPRGILHVNNDGVVYMDKGFDPYFVKLDLARFFPPPTPPNILNDPRALYDPQSERFFVTCSEFAATGAPDTSMHAHLNLFVSTTSHPVSAGDWIKYRFDVTRIEGSGAGEIHYALDFPQVGIDDVAFHLTGNYFQLPLTGASPHGVGIVSFPKAQLLSGGPVTPLTTYISADDPNTLQPVSAFWTPGAPANASYFVEIPRFMPTSVRLWALEDPLGARALSSALITVPDHGQALDLLAPQGGDVRIRTWSGVAQGLAQWREGSIWFAATGDTASDLDQRTRVSWYRVAPNGFPSGLPGLVESGVIDGGAGVWTFLPALGITPRGDVGIVYQQSSATLTPGMMFTTRAAGAPSFAASQLVKSSPEPASWRDYPCPFCDAKWGDDYTVSADPADSSLWLTCELADNLQSGTVRWVHEWANVIFDEDANGWPADGRRVRQGQTAVASVAIAADDSGGAYLGWHDTRTLDGQHANLFAQRVLPTGAHAGGWPVNGAMVQQTISRTPFVTTIADGSGGVYVACLGSDSSTAVAMHVGRQGAPAGGWPASPVIVDAKVASPFATGPDGAGGLFIAAVRGGVGLRLQHVSPAGALLWSPVPVLAASGATPVLAPDMAGGAFVAWMGGTHGRITHVQSSGTLDPAWPAGGLDIGTATTPRVVADGSGGVFLVVCSGGDVIARRLLANGSPAPGWAGPVVVCAAPGSQSQPAIAADGGGGLLVAWADSREPSTAPDVFAQRLTGAGNVATGWPVNGLQLCGAPGEQVAPAVAADGAGGVLVAWVDGRGNPECSGAGCGSDVYWTRASADGHVDGTHAPDGDALAAAPGDQSGPVLARTGSGTAVAAWLDGRSTPDGDPAWVTQVFAQRLLFDTTPGVGVPPRPAAIADALGMPRPNPTNSGVRFEASLSQASGGRSVELGVFDVGGRLVKRLLAAAPGVPGTRTLEWDLRDEADRRVPTGRYYLRLKVDARTYTRSVTVR